MNDSQEWADFDFEINRFHGLYSVYELGEESEELGIKILHEVTRDYLEDLHNVIALVLARTEDEDEVVEVKLEIK